jgi:site-specific DNA-methyltransferase (adenine-specific)
MQFMDIKNGRFYLGDCLEVMKEIPDGVIDLTVTSPPYDDLRTYNGYSFDFENIAKELYRITKEGGVIVWVVADATKKGSETGTSFKQALYFMECGFNLHDTMIYEKNGTGACGSNNCYWQTFEYMFVFTKGKIKTVHRLDNGKPRTKGGIKLGRITKDGIQKVEKRSDAEGKLQLRSNIWRYNVGFTSGDDKTGHPAVFPEALARDHILSWSNEGDLVLDPFGGSGTTACMAIETGRKWVTCEISEEYATKAVERIWKREVKPQEPTGEVKIESCIPIPEGEENGN